MALDFSIDGVNGKKLWELIKNKNCCGVGHYGGASVHLDAARPRFWEAATSKVRTGESDYNRFIYLSTDYDRYRAGDTVRLSLSAVSNYGFGIKRTVAVVDDPDGNKTITTAQIKSQEDADCIAIPDRKTSHFISLTLPPNLREGRHRIRIDFCQRPFEQMPLKTVSNEIELIGPARCPLELTTSPRCSHPAPLSRSGRPLNPDDERNQLLFVLKQFLEAGERLESGTRFLITTGRHFVIPFPIQRP